jgi:hypothetical protein
VPVGLLGMLRCGRKRRSTCLACCAGETDSGTSQSLGQREKYPDIMTCQRVRGCLLWALVGRPHSMPAIHATLPRKFQRDENQMRRRGWKHPAAVRPPARLQRIRVHGMGFNCVAVAYCCQIARVAFQMPRVPSLGSALGRSRSGPGLSHGTKTDKLPCSILARRTASRDRRRCASPRSAGVLHCRDVFLVVLCGGTNSSTLASRSLSNPNLPNGGIATKVGM